MTAASAAPACLSRFPKTRPVLSPAMAAIYREHYRMNRAGGTPASALSRALESWLHKQVARDVVSAPAGQRTLEIGAGTLNQLDFEPQVGPYDVVEPFAELYAGSRNLSRVRQIHAQISDVPRDARYDRITAVATLEHICDLPRVVARAALLLAPKGTFRVAIPSEGTLLWGLGWRLTTGIEFWLRHRLDYGELMRHEHVNSAREIEQVLEYCFERVERRVFGLSRALSLYQSFVCSRPIASRCEELL
jgi:hypothetical protein